MTTNSKATPKALALIAFRLAEAKRGAIRSMLDQDVGPADVLAAMLLDAQREVEACRAAMNAVDVETTPAPAPAAPEPAPIRYQIKQATPEGLWTSPELEARNIREVGQIVLGGFLQGQARWAVEVGTNRFLGGMDGKGKALDCEPTMNGEKLLKPTATRGRRSHRDTTYGQRGGEGPTRGKKATTYVVTLPDGRVVTKRAFDMEGIDSAAAQAYQHDGVWYIAGITWATAQPFSAEHTMLPAVAQQKFLVEGARFGRYSLPKEAPTAEQLAALHRYVRANGVAWKDALQRDWMRAGYPSVSDSDGAQLQQLRNTHGTLWLHCLNLDAVQKPQAKQATQPDLTDMSDEQLQELADETVGDPAALTEVCRLGHGRCSTSRGGPCSDARVQAKLSYLREQRAAQQDARRDAKRCQS